MMRGHFRYSVWDPFLIISQILTIQAIFYMSLGVCIFLTDIISGYSQSLDQLFLYKVSIIKLMLKKLLLFLCISGISVTLVSRSCKFLQQC